MEIIEKKIDAILPGDIILHPIFRQDGLILIGRYKKITSSLLKHLKVHCDSDFPVLVLKSDAEYAEFIQSAYFKTEKFVRKLQNLYEKHKNYLSMKINFASYTEYAGTRENTEILQQQPNTLLGFLVKNPSWTNLEDSFRSPSVTERAGRAKQSIANVLRDDSTIHGLFEQISNFHNVLLTHSVNTMCAALSIGLTLELTVEELTSLAFSTLFADIGYTRMDKQKFVHMLNTGERNAFIAEHIRQSIDIIKDSPVCRARSVIMGIMDHHEHFDGNGFPNGKRGQDISLFGRIIAISQAYDELAGGYIQEKSMPILAAQALIWAERGTKWDNQILSTFVYRREFCKLGQAVVFRDNRRGRIVGFTDFANYPLYPTVEVGNDKIDFHKTKDLDDIKSILRNG
jgi:HD-GYP domain-containing protein (c-di-GMP phosphodiesterase class II)